MEKAHLFAVVNFIQQPLPDGSSTGAGHSGQSGALGMGQRASTGLTTCEFLVSTFFCRQGMPDTCHSQHILVLFDAYSGCLHCRRVLGTAEDDSGFHRLRDGWTHNSDYFRLAICYRSSTWRSGMLRRRFGHLWNWCRRFQVLIPISLDVDGALTRMQQVKHCPSDS
jgi:hypothetical protein